MSNSENAQRDSRADLAALLDSYEQCKAAAAKVEAEVRRVHPERMNEHDWRRMRVSFLDNLQYLQRTHQSMIDRLKADMEASDEPNRSRCYYPPPPRTS